MRLHSSIAALSRAASAVLVVAVTVFSTARCTVPDVHWQCCEQDNTADAPCVCAYLTDADTCASHVFIETSESTHEVDRCEPRSDEHRCCAIDIGTTDEYCGCARQLSECVFDDIGALRRDDCSQP